MPQGRPRQFTQWRDVEAVSTINDETVSFSIRRSGRHRSVTRVGAADTRRREWGLARCQIARLVAKARGPCEHVPSWKSSTGEGRRWRVTWPVRGSKARMAQVFGVYLPRLRE